MSSSDIPAVGATAFWIAGMRAEETRKNNEAMIRDPFAADLLVGGESHFAEFRRCGGLAGLVVMKLMHFVIFPVWAFAADLQSFRPLRAISTSLRNLPRSLFLTTYEYTLTEHARRTRFIDEALLLSLTTPSSPVSETRQVVILGAGLDTRALRLPFPPKTTVLEIDHPAVFSHKDPILKKALASGKGVRNVISRTVDANSSNVDDDNNNINNNSDNNSNSNSNSNSNTRDTVNDVNTTEQVGTTRVAVPMDYEETRSWAHSERLSLAGFSVNAPMAVVMEGLVMYLDDADQEALFAEIGGAAGKGSIVVGDTYLFPFKGDRIVRGMRMNSLSVPRLKELLVKAGFKLEVLIASTDDSIAYGGRKLPWWGDYEQFFGQRYFFKAIKV